MYNKVGKHIFLNILALCLIIVTLILVHKSFIYNLLFGITFEKILEAENINQKDERLIDFIKQNHLFYPTGANYNLTVADTSVNLVWTDSVSQLVLKLLGGKRNGFFLECGANDGEFLSNTLEMELKFGWTGLLVEADPIPFSALKHRHRRAILSDVCLSTQPHPQKIEMLRHKSWNGMSYIQEQFQNRDVADFPTKFEAKCFPLFSMLLASGTKVVDYLSLDIEGAELAVLKTFPFDGEIQIKIISLELNDPIGELSTFLTSKGYRQHAYIEGPYAKDVIFVHNSITIPTV